MADHLASIFGTEKDRVNCPFFFKSAFCSLFGHRQLDELSRCLRLRFTFNLGNESFCLSNALPPSQSVRAGMGIGVRDCTTSRQYRKRS